MKDATVLRLAVSSPCSFRATKRLRAVLDLGQDAEVALFYNEVRLRTKDDWKRRTFEV